MKKILLILVVISVFLSSAANYVYGEEKTLEGSFTRIIGQVKIRRENSLEWINAEENMPIYPLDQIKIGTKSEAEITFDEGTIIRLEEESFLIINEVILEEKTQFKKFVLKINNGQVLSNLEKFIHPKSKFEIQGPGGVVVAARGTEFLVEVSKDKKVEIAVFGGMVGVKNEKVSPEKEILVPEEKETIVELSKEPLRPRNLTEKFLRYRAEKIHNFRQRIIQNRRRINELRKRKREWLERKKLRRLERIEEKKRKIELELQEKKEKVK